MGDYLTYVDFILYEIIEFFQHLMAKANQNNFNEKYINLANFHKNFVIN